MDELKENIAIKILEYRGKNGGKESLKEEQIRDFIERRKIKRYDLLGSRPLKRSTVPKGALVSAVLITNIAIIQFVW